MSGTNFNTGVATRTKYSGNTDSSNNYQISAHTKFVNRTAVIHCVGSEADNAERTTDFTFPVGTGNCVYCIVKDVFLNIKTVDATETVDVGTEGTSNDPNGFLAAASLATEGIVIGSLADGAVTRGALLYEITEATTAAARKPAVISAADPVSYTCSAGTDTAVFDIIIEYVEVVEENN
jgi:hypothetical protein